MPEEFEKKEKEVVETNTDVSAPPPKEAPPAEVPEGEQQKTPEENIPGWKKRVKEYYKDREFESDEDISAAAEEMIDDLLDYKTKGQEANAKLVEIFESEPAIAEFMADVMKGASPEVAIARNFDLDALTPMEGEPDYAAWEEARNNRKKRLEEQRKFEEELTANQVESSKAFEDFVNEHDLSEEEADGLLDEIDALLKDIYRGYVSKDFLNMMHKVTGYEEKLAKAREEGKLNAKNEAVKLEKKNYDKKQKGDGLPKVGNTGSPKDKPKRNLTRFERTLAQIEEKEKRRI
jgi:hypothetical protein